MVTWRQDEEKEGKMTTKGNEETLVVVDMFIILIAVMASQVCMYVYTYIRKNFSNFIYMKVKGETESLSVMSDSLQPHGLYSPWNSPG